MRYRNRELDLLHNSDLDAFVELVRRAEREATPLPGESPASTLRADSNSDDLMHRNEYARLQRSLKIAWVAGDVSEFSHRILDVIVDDFSADDHRYLPLAHSEEWLRAIRWAIPRIRPSAADSLPHHGQDRQFQVGTACRRLRDRGYRVHIDALGPHLDDDTRREIAEHIDSLIAQIGGGFAAQQICAFIGKTGRVHDGMWLLGNLIGSFDRPLLNRQYRSAGYYPLPSAYSQKAVHGQSHRDMGSGGKTRCRPLSQHGLPAI